ncbi:hypothetical protein JCM10296v2_006459 [Rhodotorula toruloides]
MTATLSAGNAATAPLLRLPHELLDYIFALAYSDYNDDLDDDLVDIHSDAQRMLVPAGTVCRALQPFVTKQLYGRIHFSSQTAFASLCAVLVATPQLASLVTDLRISLANELYRHYDAVYGDRAVPRSVEAANGPMTVPAELVSAAAPLLVNLRLLTLDNNPTHPYPALPRIGACTLPFPALASLRVDGPAFGSESLSYDIGAFFPNLRLFDAYDLDEVAPILPLLGTLPCTLRHLHLDRTLRHLGFGQASGITDDVLAEIASLPQITMLELDHVIGSKGVPLLKQASLEQLKLLPELWEPCDWDWQKPYGPPGVTLEGIKAAVVMARSNGIVVDGTALDVPEDFDEAWQREIVSVVSEQYIKTGDLSMLGELDVTLSEVLEYVRGTVLSLREEHGVPTPPSRPS